MQKPKPRKRVLFVDDQKSVHAYEKEIVKRLDLKPRFARFPEEAQKIISRRMTAVNVLLARKQAKYRRANTPEQKKALLRDIRVLRLMLHRPFDLIVSDINMPSKVPSGIQFVKTVKEFFPRQKILMHSDDVENLDMLWEELQLPSVDKGFYEAATRDTLQHGITAALKKKK